MERPTAGTAMHLHVAKLEALAASLKDAKELNPTAAGTLRDLAKLSLTDGQWLSVYCWALALSYDVSFGLGLRMITEVFAEPQPEQ